jgi:hypothetical protein
MSKDTVVQLRIPEVDEDLLSTMLCEGAQRLVAHAVKVELERYLSGFVPDIGNSSILGFDKDPPVSLFRRAAHLGGNLE